MVWSGLLYKLWDVRKAGRNAVLMSLDWHQDQDTAAAVDAEHSGGSRLGRSKSEGAVTTVQTRAIRYLHTQSKSLGGASRYAGPDLVRHAACVAHSDAVMGLRYTPCGSYILSSGNDSRLRVWRVRDGKLLPSVFNGGVKASLPYAMEIAECGGSSADDLLLLPCDRARNRFNNSALQSEAADICMFSLHGSSSGDAVKVLKGHLDIVTACVYRKTLQQVISASKDGLILMWEPRESADDEDIDADADADHCVGGSTLLWAFGRRMLS